MWMGLFPTVHAGPCRWSLVSLFTSENDGTTPIKPTIYCSNIVRLTCHLRPILNDNNFLVTPCHHSTAMTHGMFSIPAVYRFGGKGMFHVPWTYIISTAVYIWCKSPPKIGFPKPVRGPWSLIKCIEADDKLHWMKSAQWCWLLWSIRILVEKSFWYHLQKKVVGAHGHF